MTLAELVSGVSGAHIVGDAPLAIGEVRDDSRQVQPGDVFVAISGTVADGRRFLAEAAARGASALVVEKADAASAAPGSEPWLGLPGAVVIVPDARHALAKIAAKRWDTTPALTLMAVTGTNGKTTTTYLLEAMLAAAGIRSGVIGTIAYRVEARLCRDAPLTTPGALALHALFAEMQAAGATDVVLEASSHALAQRRLDGCLFRVAGLTNLTQDHLDYHGSMARYLDAKALLFEKLLDPHRGVAVLPMDRPEGRALRGRLPPQQAVLGIAVSGVTGEGPSVDVAVQSFAASPDGVRARLATPIGPLDIASSLVGGYNLANITLAVGMAIARGIPGEAIVRGLAALQGVPGRLQRVPNSRGVLAIVDYAHTPDALERAMAALRPMVVSAGARLITVFGCGGDRDRGKRPLMGDAAVRDSDLVVITSDNPRGEAPGAIIAEIVAGAGGAGRALTASELLTAGRGFFVEPDRRSAIRAAVEASRAGDVLLLAGKGHEDYQIIAGTRAHFDDREEVAKAFARVALDAPVPTTPAGAT
jgi:UDP-N-acetylmuramoyl-L-alanyl-D-glutamate--2,6-diaminopimelate ligase